jgi:serine protease AprX
MRSQALLLALLTGLAQSTATLSDLDKLHVMLQGASPVDLAALVESKGGSITHELHIIDAVGATVTQEQLDQVLTSPLVSRHIDDLLVKENEEDAQQKSPHCDAAI